MILKVCQEAGPQTVEQLANRIEKEIRAPRKEILETLFRLQRDGKLDLRRPLPQSPLGFFSFAKAEKSFWYWETLAISIATMLTVLLIPEDSFPWTYVRYGFGAAAIIWLPGYALTKALFPGTSSRSTGNSLDIIERIALSLLMSVVVVIFVGLVLNYTVFGIRPTPVVLSLMALTVIFATTGITRQFSSSSRASSEESVMKC